jgi:hypothetical protein
MMTRRRATLVAVLVFAIALAIGAPAIAIGVLVLAGPHSDLLPQPGQVVVLMLGYCAAIAGPVWLARRVYWRMKSPPRGDRSSHSRE